MAAKQITIIGAGIGGLTAALALNHFGFDVRVIEQTDALQDVGAGIQISPNGFCVLDALGLGPALDAVSVRGGAVSLRDYQAGKPVAHLDLNRFGSAIGYRFFHRADLIQTLKQACDAHGISVMLGCRVERIINDRGDVETTKGPLNSDLLIGADGIHSKTRAHILGQSQEPPFTGQVAWRALVPNRINHPNAAWVHMGPHRHIVSYPLRGGDILNVVMVQEQANWAQDGWNVPDDPSVVRHMFADFSGPIADVLAGLDTVHKWGLFRHPVASQWWRNRIVMMGDAAHPTLPFMAQGAVQAIEDAWALAATLAKYDDAAAAFGAYQALRLPRVQRVIAAANRNAWKYHLAFGPLRFGAHTALRVASTIMPASLVRQFDWVYNYDITKAV